MRITDFDPRWKAGVLVIDCPCGKCGGRIRVRTQLAEGPKQTGDEHIWQVSGEFPDLTLTPSVDAGCWHGFITNGDVKTC
jgi:hypothetical protein